MELYFLIVYSSTITFIYLFTNYTNSLKLKTKKLKNEN